MTSARRTIIGLCLAAAALGHAARATAQTLPTLTAPVTDLANVIDAGTEAELDRRLRALHAATGDTIVVATVDTIAPFGSIEEYAVQLFERAGIGDRQRDTGALLLVAVNDRKVRIEVGYGLEEFITDGFAGETIRQAILPAFRDGQYGAGVLAGATRLVQRVAERRGAALTDVPAEAPRPREDGPPAASIALMIILFIVMMNLRRRGRRGSRFGPHIGGSWGGWLGGLGGFGGGAFGGGFGGRGGGGGFGGFGGFGGGRSGGGGASGGW